MLSSQQGAILARLVRINWDVYLKCRIIGSITGLGRGPENCNLTNAPLDFDETSPGTHPLERCFIKLLHDILT